MTQVLKQQLFAQFPWAVDFAKLETAWREAGAAGKGDNDAAVKAIYVRLLGKVQEVVGAEGTDEATGFDALGVKALRTIAEANGIDHDGLKKAELIAALVAANIEVPAAE